MTPEVQAALIAVATAVACGVFLGLVSRLTR
jgi:hypothetical protein